MRGLAGFALALIAAAAGCGEGGGDSPPAEPSPTQVSVGEKLFDDPTLSAGGLQACATCHVERNAHADPAGTFLPLGGPLLDQQGLRSSPSLRYLDTVTAFTVLGTGGAQGGLFWDGRADDRAAQARSPLFSPTEMANPDAPSFVARLRTVPYFQELLTVSGLGAGASDIDLVNAVLQALQAYQEGDGEFHRFTSRFDAVLDGRATLTAQEARGLVLFNNPAAGNCAACHPSELGPNGEKPLFSSFRYFALGVPRNSSSHNADPAFFDLGLCGPKRTDLAARNDLCGLFKAPSLRNVGLTAPYFHNGAFTTLREAVAFYATRDTDPALWYPTVGGVVQKFNDLPAAHHGNVTQLAPFGRLAGQAPALSPQDVDDIVAFLLTLTDGNAP